MKYLKNAQVKFFHDFIIDKMDEREIERLLSISYEEWKKKIIAPHSVLEAFYLAAKWLNRVALSTHR